MGPRSGLDAAAKRKISVSPTGSPTPVFQPLVQSYQMGTCSKAHLHLLPRLRMRG